MLIEDNDNSLINDEVLIEIRNKILNKDNQESIGDSLSKVNYEPLDGKKNNILHVAAMRGYHEVIKALRGYYDNDRSMLFPLYSDALTVKNQDGYAPIHLAAISGCWQPICNNLLGSMFMQDEREKNTPLHFAVRKYSETGFNEQNPYINIIKAALATSTQSMMMQNVDGDAPIHIAIKKNNLELISFMCSYYEFEASTANSNYNISDLINIGNSLTGNTPLHLAAKEGHHKTIEILANFGVNINTKNHEGKTPLHLAAENNHPKAIRNLCRFDADIEAEDNNKKTPFSLIVTNKNPKIMLDAVTQLVFEGCNSNVVGLEGERVEEITGAIILGKDKIGEAKDLELFIAQTIKSNIHATNSLPNLDLKIHVLRGLQKYATEELKSQDNNPLGMTGKLMKILDEARKEIPDNLKPKQFSNYINNFTKDLQEKIDPYIKGASTDALSYERTEEPPYIIRPSGASQLESNENRRCTIS